MNVLQGDLGQTVTSCVQLGHMVKAVEETVHVTRTTLQCVTQPLDSVPVNLVTMVTAVRISVQMGFLVKAAHTAATVPVTRCVTMSQETVYARLAGWDLGVTFPALLTLSGLTAVVHVSAFREHATPRMALVIVDRASNCHFVLRSVILLTMDLTVSRTVIVADRSVILSQGVVSAVQVIEGCIVKMCVGMELGVRTVPVHAIVLDLGVIL